MTGKLIFAAQTRFKFASSLIVVETSLLTQLVVGNESFWPTQSLKKIYIFTMK